MTLILRNDQIEELLANLSGLAIIRLCQVSPKSANVCYEGGLGYTLSCAKLYLSLIWAVVYLVVYTDI